MNILETIMNAGGGGAVSEIAKSLGVGESQARRAVGQLLPALARGLTRNGSTQEGLGGLLNTLTQGNHQRYLDDPSILGTTESVQEGNGILGHIFGSKDVSRQVASRAAANTELGTDVLKKMLPMMATMVMGTLSKQASRTGMLGTQATPQQATGLGGLATTLDFDRDGSIADDILGLASKRFFS